MGCHTWFWKPSKAFTKEFMLEHINKCVEDAMLFNERCLHGKLTEEDQKIIGIYPQFVGKAHILSRNRMLWELKDKISNPDITYDELAEEFLEWEDSFEWDLENRGHIQFIPNKGWFEEVEGWHDVFRKYGYPDTVLSSLEETLEYIRNPHNECEVYESTEERLTKFFKDYPDGVITFG